MVNGCQKGKAGERELSHKLFEVFGAKCRRGQQFCGASGDADVVGIDGIHFECKRAEKLNLRLAVEQAIRDAEPKGNVPTVCHRTNRQPWLITLRLDDVPAFVSALNALGKPQAATPA